MRLQQPAIATVNHLFNLVSLYSTTASTATMNTLTAATAPNSPTVAGQGTAKIHLYTAGTPNGYKASIALEELRVAYPDKAKNELSYDIVRLKMGEKEQKVGVALVLTFLVPGDG